MRYSFFLILIISSIWASGPARADVDRYRVEVLVLTHLQSTEQPREVQSPKNYSEAIDFLTPTEETEEADEAGAEQPDADAALSNAAPEAPAAAPQEMPGMAVDSAGDETLATGESEEPPPLAVQVEEMSPVMQEAWRRLRLSAPFRPQQYLSWEQASEPPFPLLRLHDQDVVMVDDPWADLRQQAEQAETGAPEGEKTAPDEEVAAAESQDMPDDEEGVEAEDVLPEPTVYYRLDGTVRLRRSRFLHIDIDLSLREPVYEEAMPAAEAPPVTIDADAEPALPRPSSFRVYRLEQSRQVRSNRMEYFDSPVLGVLVYVTGVEPEETGPEDTP